MALESTITSGTIPLCSTAQKAPVRPTPVWTSSAIRGMDRVSVISRIRRIQSSGAGFTPPSPCTGSRIMPAACGCASLGIVQEALGPPGGRLRAAIAADTEGAAVVLRERQPRHPYVLGAARSGQGSRRHPVVGAGEGEKSAASGRGTDQLERRFHGVRTGRSAELDPGVVGELPRQGGKQLRGEGVLDRGREVEHVQRCTRVDHFPDRLQDHRVVVPERQGACPGETVEVSPPVRTLDRHPTGPYRHDRQ